MGDGDDIQRSSSKKRKSRKTAETTTNEINEPQDEQPSRTKKSRKKDADHTAAVHAPIPPESTEGVTDGKEKPSKKEKKKRKKNKDSITEEEVVQPVDGTAVPETPLDEDTTSKPKKKKSKKRDPSPSHETDAIEEPVKKKRKRSKPDPSEDEALSEQARKALIYAHSYVRYPDSWKFNKARQNWLIRNIWSDELIPETYFPMSVKYLSSVQGGIREALIQACKTLITGEAGAEANAEATDTPKDDAATNGEQTSDVKRTRAQLLLDTLQVES
ncbi:hypothetical protein CCMSSC00406_0001647 [Pleurotus cornucopiae]|uniref:Uncharacterized protein n=1 Tax=Pleurotus cornucopiae TaxID=5321 RepID=A0ACB7ILY8_PLECO|nr:hypothetical protein CCMSSC00406_0001647 [Pleurotus cornucopiae]